MKKYLLLLITLLMTSNIYAQSLYTAKSYIEQGRYLDAAKQLRPLADGGNAEAQYLAAKLFFEGKGVQKNEQQGIKYATLSADQGYTDAILIIFNYYGETMKERKKALSILTTYMEKLPNLKTGIIGYLAGLYYQLGWDGEIKEDYGWSLIEKTDIFKNAQASNEPSDIMNSYWEYQIKKEKCNNEIEYVEKLFSSGNNSQILAFTNYIVISNFNNDYKGFIKKSQELANQGNTNAAIILLAYYESHNKTMNFIKQKQELAKIAINGNSPMGASLYAKYKRFPCAGDKHQYGTIIWVRPEDGLAGVLAEVNCRLSQVKKKIATMNSETHLFWQQVSAQQLPSLYDTYHKATGDYLRFLSYFWGSDGVYSNAYRYPNWSKHTGVVDSAAHGSLLLLTTINF
ncbi:MAG: sel1 repeat family protein [Prevotella sp.]|nr:sel1 repeat family protein [Prevotella sp.]